MTPWDAPEQSLQVVRDFLRSVDQTLGAVSVGEARGQTTESRVTQALAGLRPGIEVTGRPPVRWSLAERMAFYKVPGVSIALVDNGRIGWAHGFGLKQVGTRDSVRPATLFQAASISKPVSGTATLHLVDRGILKLDENVNTYLKSPGPLVHA